MTEVLKILRKAKENHMFVSVLNEKLRVKVTNGQPLNEEILKELKVNKESIINFLTRNKSEIIKKSQIPKINRESNDTFPLSYAQDRLWYLDKIQGSSNYHITNVLKIFGRLDIDNLKRSFLYILQRHEILRTIYIEKSGIPNQKVLPVDDWKLNVQNQTNLNFSKSIHGMAEKSFDLSKDYMLRVSLAKIRFQEYRLIIVIHHIAADGWSSNILIKELVELYNSFQCKETPNLSDLPIQYIDYSYWQKNTFKESFLERSIEYWKEKLKGMQYLEIPYDFANPPVMSSNGKVIHTQIESETLQKLKKLCQISECTLFMVLLAGFKILSQKYSGQDDICVGIPVANRPQFETHSLIGFFVNALAIRTIVDQNSTVFDLLKKIKSTVLEAYEFQDAPFEKVIEAIETSRDLSRSPIFPVMFSYQSLEQGRELKIEGCKVEFEDLDDGKSKYDLVGSVVEKKEGLDIYFQYCTDLFVEETINIMMQRYCLILDQMSDNSSVSLKKVNLLTADEDMFLNQNYFKKENFLDSKNIIDLFEAQVLATPDNLAIVSNGTTMTYHELNIYSNRLANYLIKSYDLEKGQIVGILTNRSHWYIIAILGVLKTGATYLPIDIEAPFERKKYILRDAKVKAIIVESDVLSEVIALGIRTFSINIMLDLVVASSENVSISKNNGDQLAYVIYTSGSTGNPKGVMVGHDNVINLSQWHNSVYSVNEKSKGALFASISFDASVWEIYPYLLKGSCLFPISDSNVRYDSQELFKFITKFEISHIYLPTQVCLEFISKDYKLPFTKILTGGEALVLNKPTSLKVYNNYGPTENTVVTSFYKITENDIGVIPIGKPVDNVSIYILDQYLSQVPSGIYGELYIGGKSLSKGYLNQRELTETKFINNPFGEGLLFNSGDLVRWDAQGILEFKGRKDNQIKIRGFRVELGEIEMALKSHPYIESSVVLMIEEIEIRKRLTAFIVGNNLPSIKAIKSFLKSYLPNYMIPTEIIQVDSIPLTGNGKIDIDILRLKAKSYTGNISSYVGPKDQTELKVTGIWKEVLGISKISTEDNFFELGGHSLMATRIISKVKEDFKIKIAVKDIFNYPTISQLSYFIENKDSIDEKLNENINLGSESKFELDLSHIKNLKPNEQAQKKILLTGATGFLGVYLLNEILVETKGIVYCLIRAENENEGRERIINSLKYYFLFDEIFLERIIPVLGDLSKPNIGLNPDVYNALSTQVDYIFHSATMMDHFSSYDKLRNTNVKGNLEILRFATTTKLKKVIYTSTLPKYYGKDLIKEIDSRDWEKHKYSSGYAGSKWVGEKLMNTAIELGVDIQIYRIGLVTGDLNSGRMPKEQWFPKLLKSCYEIGSYTPEFLVPIIPVDFVSKVIVGLSFRKKIRKGIFHLSNRKLISLKNMFEKNNPTDKIIKGVTMQEILIKILENSDKMYLPIIPFIGYGDPEVVNAMEGRHPVLKDNTPTIHCNKKTLDIIKKELRLDFPDLNPYFKKYLISAINEYNEKVKYE